MSKAAELAALIGSQTALSNRNLIINGAMQVAQRGTSETGVTSEKYANAPDRFVALISTMGTWTLSQSTDAPSGFSNSYKWECATADATPATGDYIIHMQRIEGQNLQHLKKGTSNAESVTVSFWVKSAKTGTFIFELYDSDNIRSISKSYNINTANTWEYKTITFAGDTTGTLNNDNGDSLVAAWWLGAGSTFTSGTLATSWEANTAANRAVGVENLADTVGNTWQITGVQLEVGETATPFEHRSYGDELRRCQRYYVQYNAGGTAYKDFVNVSAFTTTNARGTMNMFVPMRAASTLSSSGAFQVLGLGTTSSLSIVTDVNDIAQVTIDSTGTGYTVGYSGSLRSNNNSSSYIAFDAEL